MRDTRDWIFDRNEDLKDEVNFLRGENKMLKNNIWKLDIIIVILVVLVIILMIAKQ